METVFDLIDSVELATKERIELLSCIDAYAKTPDGSWLKDIDYRRFCFYWERDWKNRDIQGALLPALKKIFLRPENFMFVTAPVAVHELRHYHQYRKYGKILYRVLSLLSRLPLLYYLSPLEKDALDQQDRAFKFTTENCQ